MARLAFIKVGNLFAPADPVSAQVLDKKKQGAVIHGEFTEMRNPTYHRKYMVLLTYAFDIWEPQGREYQGVQVAKNFDQFRADIAIKAGFYTAVFGLDGELQLKAKSISFAKMDQEEFERLYSVSLDVLLASVLHQYKREQVNEIVNRLMEFA